MFYLLFSRATALAAAALFLLFGRALAEPKPEVVATVEMVIQQLEKAGTDPQTRLASLSTTKVFPGLVLIELLAHPELKVRSAALEWLESRAGSDFGYDPFLPQTEVNRDALTAWREWWQTTSVQKPSKATTTPSTLATGALTEERFLAAVGGLLAGKVEQRERSWQTLAAEGLGSAARLERWLTGQIDLVEGSRARIREAQFRLVIAKAARTEAAALARELVFGTRQAKLAALGRLKGLGPVVVPALMEFVADPDSLIRETAVEALLAAGGRAATSLVQPRLEIEQDENVLHAILKGCEDNSKASVKVLAAFTDHANEDLAVASLQALGRLKATNVEDRVLMALKDSRWRVRTAALEAVGGMKLMKASPQVWQALKDADPFVISTAVMVAGKIMLVKAAPQLEELAIADPSFLAPVVESLLTMNLEPGPKLVASAMKAPGEHALSFVQVIVKQEKGIKALVTLAGHADPDVATAAIHGLAKAGPQEASYRSLIRAALANVSGEPAFALVEALDTAEMVLEEKKPRAAGTVELSPQEISDEVAEAKVVQNPDVSTLYQMVGAPAEAESVVTDPLRSSARAMLRSRSDNSWQDPQIVTLLEKFLRNATDPKLAILAAQKLSIPGHKEACRFLLKSLPEMAVHERVDLAEKLYSGGAAMGKLPLLRALLVDEAVTVRQEAVRSTMEHAENSATYVEMLLGALDDAGKKLRPEEITGYSLYNFDEEEAKTAACRWGRRQLKESASVPRQVLALSLLSTYGQTADYKTLESVSKSSDPYLRRAAWFAMVQQDRQLKAATLLAAADDSSAKVRAIVPYALTAESVEWMNWFSDRVGVTSNASTYKVDRVKPLTVKGSALLQRLSEDSDVTVRLEAQLALLTRKVEVPLPALAAALAAYPDQSALRRRIALFLTENYKVVGRAGGVLIQYADLTHVNSSELADIEKKFLPSQAKGLFSSFAALAVLEAPAAKASKPAEALFAEALQEKVTLVYFFKPGCQACARVRDDLARLQRDLPWLTVQEYSVESAEGAERNQMLVRRREVAPALALLTPAVFAQSGALIRDGVDAGAIRALAERARHLAPEPSWEEVDGAGRALAAEEIETRYQNFGLGWVVLAGLLDGINPCAFATIIFFLSYLRIAKRSPREILMVGASYVLAVFLAYFAVGLGLSHVLTQLRGLEGARLWLTRGLALVALLIALFSFRDAFRAWRGNLSQMTMQLPEALKSRLRRVIREGAKQRHFVIAAFVTGVVISFLELACTGQVYLPTIAYMMEQGRLSAVGWLFLYNLAFILPLILIFLLSYFGLTHEALVAFQKKHTALVRLGTALLFLTLFLILVLGPRL